MKCQGVILIVDDDADIRDALRCALEDEGHTVACAANGREGLELLDKLDPCLVLLDLMMPVMSGLEVIEVLNRDGRLHEHNVVVLSCRRGTLPCELPVVGKPPRLERILEVAASACRPRAAAGT